MIYSVERMGAKLGNKIAYKTEELGGGNTRKLVVLNVLLTAHLDIIM
jgi:hypothetical protein